MIGTPIAFGLTMVVCFTLFYYYWRIRQLRARLLSVQSTAPVHDVDFPVEFGIGKNVVETFPTIKACELKSTAPEDLQCPICLVEYEEWEVLRQLPFCGHIFHTLCVGAWFEKQTTCPVCRMSMSELTEESFGGVEEILYRGPRSSDAAVVEVANEAPSWIRINRRLPLPAPPIPETTPTESAAHTCTCSAGQSHETETTTQAKISSSELVNTCGSTEFHVVNIQQQISHSACSKCKSTAKPVKAVTSGHAGVQILISQASVLASDSVRLDVESLVSEDVSNKPQETSGSSVELTARQPILLQQAAELVAGNTCSGCDSSASSNFGEDVHDPEDVFESPEGSFEFQPIVTESGELTFRATTL